MCHYPSGPIEIGNWNRPQLYQFSCCLSCWQFCGSTLCLNSSTGQGRREGHLYRSKALWLSIQIEEVVKIVSGNTSNPCPYLLWLPVVSLLRSVCWGRLFPQIKICSYNFKAARFTEGFCTANKVFKSSSVVKEVPWCFKILFSAWFGRLSW